MKWIIGSLYSAIMTVDCLCVLMKDVKDICPVGQLLRISEETLVAINGYYVDSDHKMSHMLSLWLAEGGEDPVSHLRDALNSLGYEEVSRTLFLLTSLGESAGCVLSEET